MLLRRGRYRPHLGLVLVLALGVIPKLLCLLLLDCGSGVADGDAAADIHVKVLLKEDTAI